MIGKTDVQAGFLADLVSGTRADCLVVGAVPGEEARDFGEGLADLLALFPREDNLAGGIASPAEAAEGVAAAGLGVDSLLAVGAGSQHPARPSPTTSSA